MGCTPSSVCDMNSTAAAAVCGLLRYTSVICLCHSWRRSSMVMIAGLWPADFPHLCLARGLYVYSCKIVTKCLLFFFFSEFSVVRTVLCCLQF